MIFAFTRLMPQSDDRFRRLRDKIGIYGGKAVSVRFSPFDLIVSKREMDGRDSPEIFIILSEDIPDNFRAGLLPLQLHFLLSRERICRKFFDIFGLVWKSAFPDVLGQHEIVRV
jgi:hypothetical protein